MTGLRDKVVLEIDLEDSSGTVHTGVFELKEDLEPATGINKLFLLSQRGQYFREAYDIAPDTPFDEALEGTQSENRRGYNIDGGAGDFTHTISGKAGDPNLQWGDGSTDPENPDDISKFDATGCDKTAQKDIFNWYVSQAKTGSLGQARLHTGEWTDGSHDTDAGVFGKPFTVALREASITPDPDDPAVIDVTIECVWTAVLPEAAVDEVQDLVNEIAEIIPEY